VSKETQKVPVVGWDGLQNIQQALLAFGRDFEVDSIGTT